MAVVLAEQTVPQEIQEQEIMAVAVAVVHSMTMLHITAQQAEAEL
jgi:hypothetical protein